MAELLYDTIPIHQSLPRRNAYLRTRLTYEKPHNPFICIDSASERCNQDACLLELRFDGLPVSRRLHLYYRLGNTSMAA